MVGWHSLWYINVNGRLGVNWFQVWGHTCSILQKKVLTQNENCQRRCVNQYSSCCWGCSWTCSSPSCSSVWLSCGQKNTPKHPSAAACHHLLPLWVQPASSSTFNFPSNEQTAVADNCKIAPNLLQYPWTGSISSPCLHPAFLFVLSQGCICTIA